MLSGSILNAGLAAYRYCWSTFGEKINKIIVIIINFYMKDCQLLLIFTCQN